MKARPILFSAPMVRALLEGRKTQTRRVVKSAFGKRCPIVNLKIEGDGREYSGLFNDPSSWGYPFAEDGNDIPLSGYGWEAQLCPYGQPGDLLWVRETWALASRATDLSKVYYKAHENASHTEFHKMVSSELVGRHQPTWPRFKPSIHMPRAFSRITLEITDVRVERLQDISEADKAAEGGTADKPFGTVWRAINTAPGIRWEDNPWVWAIEFTVHQQNVDALLRERGGMPKAVQCKQCFFVRSEHVKGCPHCGRGRV